MHKAKRNDCWTLLLLGAFILTFMLAFSCWIFVPRQLKLWTLSNEQDQNGSNGVARFFLPPKLLPQELKVQREQPFIYQIFH